jgi:hypothetical protein
MLPAKQYHRFRSFTALVEAALHGDRTWTAKEYAARFESGLGVGTKLEPILLPVSSLQIICHALMIRSEMRVRDNLENGRSAFAERYKRFRLAGTYWRSKRSEMVKE